MKNILKNAGLFIHWGLSTENENWEQRIPKYSGLEEFEEYVSQGGWKAEKWIDAALKMNASYITFASFHCCLGYIKAWKSCIPGTLTTGRDYLGELIEEGKKRGIKIIVYISAHPKNPEFYPGQKWIDSEAYSAWKGENYNLEDWDVWQNIYCRDIIEEITDLYPDVGGFWFDGWFRKNNTEKLFGFIKNKNPGLIIIRNNFGQSLYKNEDIMSVEDFGKFPSPDFDLVSDCWQDNMPIEHCYRMEEVSDWWLVKEKPPCDDMEQHLTKYISVAANGWMPKVGIGPYASGDMPVNGQRFLDACEEYLSWASEALFDTERGDLPVGYIKGNGYILSTKREKTHYLHLLRPADADKLIIQDGGMDFETAEDLKTGERLDFTQADGRLVFENIYKNKCNSVIRLRERKSRCIKRVEVSERAELPVTLKIRLEKCEKISGIIIEQNQTSAQKNRSWAAVDNKRLKEYVIYALDGETKAKLAEGSLNGARGRVQIDLSAETEELELVMKSSHEAENAGVYTYILGHGWHKLGYENVQSFTKRKSEEYVATHDGRLTLYEAGNSRVIAYDVKKVFSGEDGNIYFINRNNEIYNTLTGKTGFTAEKAVVDKDGNFYTITDKVLYKNGEALETGVADVTLNGECVEYLKNHSIYTLGTERRLDFEYDIDMILKQCILLKDRSVLLRDEFGLEDTYYYNDVSEITSAEGRVYVIKEKTEGHSEVTSVSVC